MVQPWAAPAETCRDDPANHALVVAEHINLVPDVKDFSGDLGSPPVSFQIALELLMTENLPPPRLNDRPWDG